MIREGRANVVIGGNWGSEAKGLLCAYLYHNHSALSVGVCDFMPNAGHTAILPWGGKFVSRQLPISVVFGRVGLIGPHAAIDLEVLRAEVEQARAVAFNGETGPIYVHPNAVMVGEEDRAMERRITGRIAGTQKGGHAANARKIVRSPGCVRAADMVADFEALGVTVADTHYLAQASLSRGATLLIETAQGFDLGLNHGMTYPFVTGRDCLVGRALDNAGVSVRDVGSIIGCVRTYPIRVGSTDEGSSGPFYDDHRELTWEEVSGYAGRPVKEMTTVTNRVRRVFGFSLKQFRRFLTFVRPDSVFLNFWNYTEALPPQVRVEMLKLVSEACEANGTVLRLLGMGPAVGQVVDLESCGFTAAAQGRATEKGWTA